MSAGRCLSWITVEGKTIRCTKRRGHYGQSRKHKHGEWRWYFSKKGKWIQRMVGE